jgi:hypothetical protein
MITNDTLGRIWKEVASARSEMLSRNLSVGLRKEHNKSVPIAGLQAGISSRAWE